VVLPEPASGADKTEVDCVDVAGATSVLKMSQGELVRYFSTFWISSLKSSALRLSACICWLIGSE